MPSFALIQNGVVANIIVAADWPGGVDITALDPKPGIGWTFANGTFTPPVPTPPVVAVTPLMTHLAFLERMTAEEYGRFENFLATSVEARFAKAKFDIARDVDVSRADVQTFAGTLRAVGVLLSDDRVAALLAPIPADSPHALP